MSESARQKGSDADLQFMQAALDQARRSRPSPNPPVGAVLVGADGKLVSKAHHVEAGADHAETAALEEAGDSAEGATIYVTLEPCNHEGRTEPCVDALLKSGVKRVVIGCLDPNPHVTGGGAKRLEEAGIEVETGVAAAECRALIAPWTKFITTGMPNVALKLAMSLDGRIATRSGESKWVTGPEARLKVQHLRSQNDAVGVGIGTAITDDPRLTVRDEALLSGGPSPVRIIFDTKLRLPRTARVVETATEVATWICAGESADADAEKILVDAGCTVVRVEQSADERIDMGAAFKMLGEAGVVSILIEGGAELAGSLLASKHADELHAFIAPIMLGPRGRPGAVDWAGPDTLGEAPRIVNPSWEVCGQDAYVYGKVDYPEKD
jgi:diaminohydroxyphosphoribosylaminopyrimidine deaminase/5-amino-6-(5-phosphoribosylamino)uracil reductase